MRLSPSFEGIAVADLAGQINRPWLPGKWRKISRAVLDTKQTLYGSKARKKFKALVVFAADICHQKKLDPSNVHIVFEESNSIAAVQRIINDTRTPWTIVISSHLLNLYSKDAALFILAHEFGHILNGDLDKKPLPLSDKERRMKEFEANKTAVTLFPTIQKGVAAGIKALETDGAQGSFLDRFLEKVLPLEPSRPKDHNLSQPTKKALIQSLKRLL